MGHSDICKDPTTRLDRNTETCVPCSIKPGYEVTPNCGYDDHGGQHEPPHRECGDNTYNDGGGAHCRNCTSCPPGHITTGVCNSTTDTQCRGPRTQSTAAPVTTTYASFTAIYQSPDAAGVKLPVVLIFTFLAVLSACIIYIKWIRGRRRALCYRRKSRINEEFSSLSVPVCNYDLEAIISPDILSAPLHTVLDNLDILEELVILLDPDSQKVKNTRHLASHWSFPSTWINYIYSMKDNKSPLKAVLEAVTSRHPDWTVSHLADQLRKMERNDAIAVVARL